MSLPAMRRIELKNDKQTLSEIAARLKQCEILDDDAEMHLGIATRNVLDAVKALEEYLAKPAQ